MYAFQCSPRAANEFHVHYFYVSITALVDEETTWQTALGSKIR